jgi:hypothetical protein
VPLAPVAESAPLKNHASQIKRQPFEAAVVFESYSIPA